MYSYIETEETFNAPPPPVSKSLLDKVFDLLMTQRADGSFPLSAALNKWLGEMDKDKAEILKEEVDKNPVIITAVVVAVLEKKAARHQAEWKRAAQKARAYLQKNGNPSVEHLI